MNESFDMSARPARDTTVAWRVVDGEAVMVLPSTGKVHTLNRVGTRFWELVDESRSFGDIAALLAEEFDASAEQIAADLRHFAGDLSERGLLRVDHRD